MPTPSLPEYEAGTEVTLSANANLGYAFAGWYNTDNELLSTDPSYVVTVNGDVNVVALYEDAPLPEGTAVTLADWNFENSTDISATYFSTAAPQIAPDSQMGSADDYLLTALSEGSYWQLCTDTKWGYVFQNNVIRPHAGVNVTDVWLGRPWHNQPKTVFINTQTFINIPAKGWYNTMGGLPALWADYNTVDANGNPVDLSQRESYYYYIDSSTGDKVEAFNVKNYLTDEEAAQYTIKNVMGGDDNWQPDLLCEATEAPAPVFNDNTISWDEVPYAICYVVTRGDEVVAITTETSVDVNAVVSAKGSAALGANDSEEPYKVQSVNEQGGLSKFGIATDATALNAVSAAKGAKINVYYNIAGQRVNSSFKGMVISDGKKYMK